MASIIKVDQIQTAAGGTPTAADLGINTTGGVVQVVNGNTSTMVTSSTTQIWVDTGITATITPTSTSSNIIVWVNLMGLWRNTNQSWNRTAIRILRGSTVLGIEAFAQSWPNTSLEFRNGGLAYSHYDNPQTTAATTYKVQFQAEFLSDNTGISVQKDNNSGTSQIFLMEIAG